MFNKPRVNVIACDEGFSVQVIGIATGLTYTEGPRRTVKEHAVARLLAVD